MVNLKELLGALEAVGLVLPRSAVTKDNLPDLLMTACGVLAAHNERRRVRAARQKEREGEVSDKNPPAMMQYSVSDDRPDRADTIVAEQLACSARAVAV